MTIIFTITYGIRAFYAIFYGLYRDIIPNYFARWLLQDALYIVWDLPSILSMVYLNYTLMKDTVDKERRLSER